MRSSKALLLCAVLAGCGGGGALAPGGGDAARGADGAHDAGAADAGGDAAPDADDDANASRVDAPDDEADATGPDAAADGPPVCPAPPIETFTGPSTIVTCPTTATAIDGIVATTCEFPYAFAPNAIFSGPVTLESHLDRDFAGFDVNRIADGRFQLMCAYANADGMGVGGIYRYVFASSCQATSATSFACAQ